MKKKVLIIDDDGLLLDMYSTKLREMGFEVEISFSGSGALEKIRAGLSPDIVLLDIIMPVMDGFEFLENVKKEKLLKNSKILILSNLGQEEDIKKGLALGATDYIIKAYFTPSEIVKKIEKLLNV
jgi:DNA-binding response OmpR family regulator